MESHRYQVGEGWCVRNSVKVPPLGMYIEGSIQRYDVCTGVDDYDSDGRLWIVQSKT